MAFKGKYLLYSKIETDGAILEQLKQFNYLGCELSLDSVSDFDKKSIDSKVYVALLYNT